MNAKLTETQATILKAAAGRPNGNIEPLPTNLRGSARTTVIEGLLARGLIAGVAGKYQITDAGYAAVGKRRHIPKGPRNVGNTDALAKREVTPPTIRPGTKILTLVELLQEPGGASIVTLLQATGWLPHTIRGAISAIVKKKLGFRVISEKGLGGERIYKIDISTPKAK